MIKAFSILLLAGLIFTGCTTSSEKKEDVNHYKKLGIKKRFDYEYEYKFGEIDSASKKLVDVYYYDKNGHQYRNEFYTEKLVEIYSDRYWDGSGYEFIPDTVIYKREYDSTGNNIVTLITDVKEKIRSRIINEFTNDKLLSSVEYDSNGKITGKEIHVYEDDTHSIKYYDSTGQLHRRAIFVSKDDINQKYEVYEDDKLIMSHTLEDNDGKNNLTYRNFDGEDSTTTLTYIKKYGDTLIENITKDSMGSVKYKSEEFMKDNILWKYIFYDEEEPYKYKISEFEYYDKRSE